MITYRKRKTRTTTLRKLACRVPLILDAEVTTGPRDTDNESVLALPLGTGSVLTALLKQIHGLGHGPVLVISNRSHAYYRSFLSGSDDSLLRVVSPAELAGTLSAYETSDYLLIVEPRFWPASGSGLKAAARHGDVFRGATHLIAIRDDSVTREQVECGPGGQIRRIARLYGEMSWPEIASTRVLCTLAPAHVLKGMEIASLGRLRARLTARGVLSQDVPVLSEIYSLTGSEDILRLNERLMGPIMSRPSVGRYSIYAPGVLVGQGCRIHPSAQLVGPIVVQDGVAIAEDARVIGPAVLGARARLGRRVVLAHGVVGFDTEVAEGALICQQVILSSGPLESAEIMTGRPRTRIVDTSRSASVNKAGLSPAAGGARRRRIELAVKRILDVTCASLGLALLSPLLLVTALLVKLTSRGPVFFVHRRETRGGLEFPCIKFRSMVANAHLMQRSLYLKNELDGPQFKMAGDPRETWLGRWLRKTNIDELPQLLNVVLGHMSLVGPRPSPFRENQICVPWREARLSVRPGITGLWQLCRDRRCDGDFHQWIYYDLAYVRNMSLWLDLKILWYTVLTGAGRIHVPLSRLIRNEAVVADGSEHLPDATTARRIER